MFTAVLWILLAQPPVDRVPACAMPVDAAAPIQKVGVFSNIRYTEEHAYGYSVELWKTPGCVFGLFLSAYGLAGDTPTGLLERVIFDEKTGALSFRARLTTGSFSNREHSNVPSRDIFEFSGTLAASALSGSVRRSNALTPNESPTTEQVELKRAKDGPGYDTMTFGDWQRVAVDILKLRGPRW